MVRPVQHHLPLTYTIVHQDFKTAGGRHQKLIAFLMSMCPAGFASRNIIEIKYPFDIERNVNLILNGRNISSPELDTWKGNNGCVVNRFQSLEWMCGKSIKIPDVITGIVQSGGCHQADRIGGKVFHVPP